jgi:UDP-glucose 4-epimerase
MKNKCLVLGANGFIGSHLVDSLTDSGYEVRAFDRYPDTRTRFIKNDKVELFAGNFLNRNDLARAVKDVDYVFHFVSTTTPATSENDPLIDIETNIKMSVELFQECVKQGVKKVIFPSSGGSVYGKLADNANEETLAEPVSPYAIGKLTIEHYLRYFATKHGLEHVVYRIANPYGERQAVNAKQGVIPIFLSQIREGQPITVLGDGSMVRDYIYVKDVADMIVQSFEKTKASTYNLSSGTGVSLNELVQVIKKVIDVEFEVKYKENNMSTFAEKIVLDTSRFTKEFGIKPKVDLKEGIRITWDFVKQQA